MFLLLDKAISFLFYILFFLVPLIFCPLTSELFEFNKMVTVYLLTVLILTCWFGKMILAKKIVFRRTIFDYPLLIFLFSQGLSTIFSIDFRTSLLGYYSRFHGGFLSYLCYSLLYWAYVSNLEKEKTVKSLRFLLLSAVLVSFYGVLQHFGIDKDYWVQDVVSRVFSTFGQPNWLASWLVVILPVSWAMMLSWKEKYFDIKHRWLLFAISGLYFLVLLYTKSRSGLLAFLVSWVVFWFPILFYYLRGTEFAESQLLKKFFILNFSYLVIFLLTPTPYFAGLPAFLQKRSVPDETMVKGPALEIGGTESGTIRKIVWKGAVDIWKHYPILGTGVETFAYSYYQFRPVEHNLVSEWDFLYNKAHNEFLNFAATTGTLGLGAYLFLIGSFIYFLIKNWRVSFFHLAFLSGIIGLEVSYFFGFSVVPTSLLLFLIPGMAIAFSETKSRKEKEPKGLSLGQKLGLILLIIVTAWFVISIGKYWLADLNYSRGKSANSSDNFNAAREYLSQAIKLSPNESIFWDELSETDAQLAIALSESGQKEQASIFIETAIRESDRAIFLSPKNVNIKRNRASTFIKLSAFDPNFLKRARDVLQETILLAPTEAKLFYNLGLTYLRLGDYENSIKTLGKTVTMKPNYRDARLAMAFALIDVGEKNRAKEQLNYILEKIYPEDPITRQTLEDLE